MVLFFLTTSLTYPLPPEGQLFQEADLTSDIGEAKAERFKINT